MDGNRFDHVTRSLFAASSRRGLLHGLVGIALGTVVATLPIATSAKKKNKKKKIDRNAFGCVNVGNKCAGKDGNCCSGICEGKKPKKAQKGKKAKKDKSSCLAHNAGICTPAMDTCIAGNVPCNPANDKCFCALTTGNAGFCGDFAAGPIALCRVCKTDPDCEAEFGDGAACIVMGGVCAAFCPATGNTACAPPCA